MYGQTMMIATRWTEEQKDSILSKKKKQVFIMISGCRNTL